MSQPRLLGGRYELEALVGRGGMAEVHRARDLRLDRMVAVKTLRSDLARDHTFQARFRREAQSAASLNHPSIIAVYDTGEDMIDDLSIPYIIMEYVDGRTLKELLDDDRRLLPERAVEIADGILRALEYSHRNGIVHRDIKPANIMLTRQAEVKVMDFGIARTMDDNQATMTQTSQVIGTAQYLSPEQARGERVDPRSDIYSTGCVLYELLTGRPPFTGDSPVSIAYQHVREEPEPPSDVDPEVPEWIEDIVLRAMTKDREERYQSAAEMRSDIQRGMQGMPTEASTMAMQPAAGPPPVPPAEERRDDYRRYDDRYNGRYDDRRGGNRAAAALWVLLGAAVLGGIVFLWFILNNSANDPETAIVPDVAGMAEEAAIAELERVGFSSIETEEEASDEYPAGQAIGTEPDVESSETIDTEITLFISSGPSSTTVPEIIGMPQSEAIQELDDAGLSYGGNEERETSEADPGTVLETTPAVGQNVDIGTEVTLVIAKGPAKVAVPSVTGLTRQEAKAELERVDLTPNFTEEVNGEVEPGRVLRQSPQTNEQVNEGSTVDVVVAKAPEGQPSNTATDEPTASEEPGNGGGNGGGGNGDGGGGEPSESAEPGQQNDGVWWQDAYEEYVR
ncbi:Stk1 family PASTA domain-containing Ser/Thr kinase [Salinactinospora qingdaonensis]|uniref:non-specific serine/threonine protein kinase n=1 Tax=Salinactinospora qingdaonensis TaxID=702744 RepID=A0ABP7FIX0_9ACTN